MSWAPGWYGWDVDSEDAAAWGPFSTSDEARGHPDMYAPDDAEVHVFYISVSDTPRRRDWANDARQRAIWVDGPDSEAARACLPRMPMLAIPVLPTDHDADRRMDEVMRKLNAARVYQPLEVEPDYRAMWEDACRERDANTAELARMGIRLGLAECDREEARHWVEELADPTHTPAVRRVVAFIPQSPHEGETPCLDRDEAYAELTDALLAAAWDACRLDIGEGDWWDHWHPQRRHDLAQWLRHRDEEAGYR